MESLTKSVYIWSKSFGQFDNDRLNDFLRNHSFNKVMLAIGPNEELWKKAMAFIDLARQVEIDTELLKANNHFIFQDRYPKIDEAVFTASKLGTSGIHLDVEPHALKLKTGNWEDQYLDMLKYASYMANDANLELAVSLPFYYGSNILKQAYNLCDKIYLMAYGKSTLEQIDYKIEWLSGNNQQTALALRVSDFKNLDQLQIFASKVLHSHKIASYAVHDLNAILTESKQNY